MTDMDPTISIITLNVIGLNTPIKKEIVNMDQKPRPTIYCLQETHFKYTDTCRLKVNGRRNINHMNTNQNKAKVAVLISDRSNFRAKKVLRDKEGYCINVKGSILQEDVRILNIYALKNRVSQYVR